MPVPHHLPLFIIAAAILLITPGPAVLYIVARSVDQGRLAGFASVLGIEVGSLFHVIAAALGLSAILVSSSLVFSIVKYLGAAYLIYLGVRKFLFEDNLSRGERVNISTPPQLPRVFTQGMVVNVLNPKTALFFFAFLPQFVDPARGAVAFQVLFLGFLFVGMAVLNDSAYALLAGAIGGWLKRKPVFLSGQRFMSGGIYIALGVTTALSGSRST